MITLKLLVLTSLILCLLKVDQSVGFKCEKWNMALLFLLNCNDRIRKERRCKGGVRVWVVNGLKEIGLNLHGMKAV